MSKSVSLQWTIGQIIAGETMEKRKEIIENGQENKK